MSSQIHKYKEKYILDFLKTLKVKFHYENKSYNITSPNGNPIPIYKYDVYIQQDIDLKLFKFNILPIKFTEVEGDFNISGIGLEKLTGSPKIIKGSFDCSKNNITSVAYGPENIGGDFICSNNKIKTLTFKKQTNIYGALDISNNQIETIKRMPKFISGSINLSNNKIKKLQNFPTDYSGIIKLTNNKSIISYKRLPDNSTIII